MNAKEKREAEVKAELLKFLKPGDTVYTQLVHVSRSGMYRVIRLFIIDDNKPFDISGMASDLLEGWDDRHYGCKASGCGMDMGFHLVYNLAYRLFSPEWECTGEHCPSNDHLNNWKGPRGAGVMHQESGYALKHKWL